MYKFLKRFFLNDRIILVIILINAVAIYLNVSNIQSWWITCIDIICTILFLIEMLVKWQHYGFRRYWREGWNRLDGTLVFLSLPSLVLSFFPLPYTDLSVLLVLRLMRVLKFFRLMHFFPHFSQIVKGFKLAMKQSWAVLAGYALIIVIFGLINCSLFREMAPEYFNTPLDSIYAVFQLFTVEGWYEIPNAVAGNNATWVVHLIRLYFCLLLIGGGIIGMSFINSVFVDAMAEDNNDDVKEQLARIETKIDELMRDRK